MSSLKDNLKQARRTPAPLKLRNYVATSAIMHKGGVHTVDNASTKHRKDRRIARNFLKKGDWV